MRDVVRVPPAHEAPSRRALAQIAFAALVATCVVFVPQLVTDAGQIERLSPLVNLAWLVVLLCVVPAVAGVMRRRLGVRADDRGALLVGLPQVFAVPALVSTSGSRSAAATCSRAPARRRCPMGSARCSAFWSAWCSCCS